MNLKEVLSGMEIFDIDEIMKKVEEKTGKKPIVLREVLEEMAMALQEQGFIKEDFTIAKDLVEDPDYSVLVDLDIATEYPTEIPVSGIVIPELEFIADPISEGKFFITEGDNHRIEEIKIEEIKGKRGAIQRVEFFIYDTEGNRLYLDGPVSELKHLPNRVKEELLTGQIDEQKLYAEVVDYVKRYIDAYPRYHHLGALFIFQSWVYDVLPSVFYLAVKAPFGGGKTTFGSTIAFVSKNGMTTSDISTASIARRIHFLKPTLFLDEIDQLDTEVRTEFLRILRVGQRREGAWYERARSDGSTVSFFVFGPKIFSVHGEIEEALSQRCFSINLYPTKNLKYTFENLTKDYAVPLLYTKLLLWRHTYGIKHLLRLKFARTITKKGKMHYNLPVVKDALSFVIKATKDLGLKGRNAELLYIISLVASTLGVLDEIKPVLKEIIQEKIQEDEMLSDREYKVLLREVITKLYRIFSKFANGELKEYFEGIDPADIISSDGYLQIPIELIQSYYRRKLKQEGMHVSSRRFAGILRELGLYEAFRNVKRKMIGIEFDDKQGVFKVSSPASRRRVLLFTEDVAKKLGIESIVKKSANLSDFGGDKNAN